MRSSDYPKIKLKIERRPPEPKPDHACTFICAICETPTDTHQENWERWDEIEKPPICHRCVLYSASKQHGWVNGMNSHDYTSLGRLGAIIRALEGKASNGKPYRTAY